MEITGARRASWIKKMKKSIEEQYLSLKTNMHVVDVYHLPKAKDKSTKDRYKNQNKMTKDQIKELEFIYDYVSRMKE